MSDRTDRREEDPADAEGERVCAALRGQLDHARELVEEARTVLGRPFPTIDEPKSFAPRVRS